MARELHDAVLNADPHTERDRHALHTIRQTSLSALDELRQMVQVLRSQGQESDDGAAELLTNTTWDQVLAHARNHGLSVEIFGELPEHLTPTERGVVTRILQESLANALRHGARKALVRLERTSRRLTLTVDSEPSGAAREPQVHGAGTGIIAMQKRARSIGGSVTAAGHNGAWRVQAEIPLQPSRGPVQQGRQ
ncbi:hypothetical protein [Nesterenkonia sp.]|uniref:sensor histidine kinase n=1 Tax=Nesterenkonia sp. TaxID=704201 RepID=UPI00262996E2|nr:hypothetical protein [Nesterenkonia sp.]